uniref:Uncharacterized protein n=1 Tax=Candidatus Kentrum sp. DK TaxID=2126562 RepID=A0A450SXR4_9GAMM|nr:MAG: hypothetical protein BECKDK2373B_GA0170837_10786 [Candidatus Kentron sp. DK]
MSGKERIEPFDIWEYVKENPRPWRSPSEISVESVRISINCDHERLICLLQKGYFENKSGGNYSKESKDAVCADCEKRCGVQCVCSGPDMVCRRQVFEEAILDGKQTTTAAISYDKTGHKHAFVGLYMFGPIRVETGPIDEMVDDLQGQDIVFLQHWSLRPGRYIEEGCPGRIKREALKQEAVGVQDWQRIAIDFQEDYRPKKMAMMGDKVLFDNLFGYLLMRSFYSVCEHACHKDDYGNSKKRIDHSEVLIRRGGFLHKWVHRIRFFVYSASDIKNALPGNEQTVSDRDPFLLWVAQTSEAFRQMKEFGYTEVRSAKLDATERFEHKPRQEPHDPIPMQEYIEFQKATYQ